MKNISKQSKSQDRVCPLTYAVGKGAYDQEVASFDDCVERRCAWWTEDKFGACALVRIAMEINDLPKKVK